MDQLPKRETYLLDLVVAHSRILHVVAGCDEPREMLRVAAEQLVHRTRDTCVGVWRRSAELERDRRVAWAGPDGGPADCPLDLSLISGSRESQVTHVDVGGGDSWAARHGVGCWTCFLVRVGGGSPIVFTTGGRQPLTGSLLDVKLAVMQGVAAMVFAAERSEQARLAHAEAEEQRARLYRLLDEAPAIVTIHRGAEHRLEFVNRRFRDLSPGADPIGKTYREVFPRYAALGIDRLFDRIYGTGEPYAASEFKAQVRGHDGAMQDRYYHLVWQPTRDAKGDVDGVMTHAVDVSAQVEARLEADAARARLEALVEAHDAVVWEAHGDPRDLHVVAGQSVALPGVDPDAPMSEALWSALVDPRDLPGLLDARRRAWLEGEASAEFRTQAAAGDPRWLYERARRFSTTDGTASVRGLIVDVTERKRIEQERELFQLRLLHSQKLESLGMLAGGIAHDFNNLLTAMMGHASLLEARLEGHEDARPNVAALVDAAHRASELTRQMLAYSGRGQVVVEPVDLSERVAGILGLLGASLPKTTRLRLDLCAGLPPVRVDVAQFQQVVMNLVINGSDALEGQAGEVVVRTGACTLSEQDLGRMGEARWMAPGHAVFLDVQDTGRGMDRDTEARIFDPFFSLKKEGRGLGLAAVQGIVRGHQGAIAVESTPGAGSRFTVYFPMGAATPPLHREAPPEAPAPVRRGAGVILVVDDEAPVRSTARALLEHFGYRVVEAGDGATGVQLLDAMGGEVDLVFLDMNMPGINGEETFHQMRARYPQARVILSSGYTDEEEAAQRMLREGLLGFLQKPYTARDLQRMLDRVLVEVDSLH